MNALFLTDGYKTGHHQQYPKGCQEVYSNWTARSTKYAPKGCDKVLSFGQQYVFIWLHDYFQTHFFNQSKAQVCEEIQKELSLYLSVDYDVSHFEALHDLQYLPIRVKSLPEGVEVPTKIPLLTIVNTHPSFYWITNFLETILSTLLWQPMTSATIALAYKRIFTRWADKTAKDNIGAVSFQGHDFSMRGMSGLDSVMSSGMAHACVFSGSDTLPVLYGLRKYYQAEGFVVGSVNATEHSVMCAGTQENEIQTFQDLLKAYPKGILSVVSDTWDLWKVVTVYLPRLKQQILQRDGKLVIRPDSGDPVAILCGTVQDIDTAQIPQEKGLVSLLWEVFGGTVNAQGFKVLAPCIGAIYGDSITLERAESICERLYKKGFATTNVVLGIGSFTYQYNTRDTFGFAMKATSVVVNQERRDIFKDPITDSGIKKSAKGLLCVTQKEQGYFLEDGVSSSQEATGALQLIYQDGVFHNSVSLSEIRERITALL